MRPEAAMIFAAGFGTRMAPLTDTVPKPMLPVAGRPMIDHCIAMIRQAGDFPIVVNTHHLAAQIESHLAAVPGVRCLRETPEILETGGGLRNALPLLGTAPVITANCDVLWSGANPVRQALAAWRPEAMDALMVLVPVRMALGYTGAGDFFLERDGWLRRRGAAAQAPYVYGGVQIIKTDALADIPDTRFSVSLLWDRMIAAGRLYGTVHDGGWRDIGHPEGLQAAEAALGGASDV
jgi:MurNAc alpha-1-phosphate uridylyltransferase